MDKKTIELIAVEVLKEMGSTYTDATFDDEALRFFTIFLSHIDAERGKVATGWFVNVNRDCDPDNPHFQQVAKQYEGDPDTFPLFLSPTIPEGMALVPELSTSAMDIAGMEAVGIEGFGKTEAEICYIAMLAAAQGERNADC